MRLPKNWQMLDSGAELVVVTRKAAPGDCSMQIGVDPTHITWNRDGKVTKSEYHNPDKWDLQRIAACYAREAESQIKRAQREDLHSTPALHKMVLGLPPYYEMKLGETQMRIILEAMDAYLLDIYGNSPPGTQLLKDLIDDFEEILGMKPPANVIPFEPK